MRVLLLGGSGQVGYELHGILSVFASVLAPSSRELDITDADALTKFVCDARPSMIVNAAAYTDVEAAEREPERAMLVNGHAVGTLGELASRYGAAVVHLSTDFVFAGTKGSAYVEADATGPINAYGRSKLAGESALLALDAPAIIFRTAWVYGRRTANFVTRILAGAREPGSMRVVDDQVGSPTFCGDLAQAIGLVAFDARRAPVDYFSERRGVYHLAGGGSCSRFALAQAVIELDPRSREHRCEGVQPATSPPSAAGATRRPANASLVCDLAADRLGVRLPPWRASLSRALAVGPLLVQDES